MKDPCRVHSRGGRERSGIRQYLAISVPGRSGERGGVYTAVSRLRFVDRIPGDARRVHRRTEDSVKTWPMPLLNWPGRSGVDRVAVLSLRDQPMWFMWMQRRETLATIGAVAGGSFPGCNSLT